MTNKPATRQENSNNKQPTKELQGLLLLEQRNLTETLL